jgi:hypothetical protein
VVGLFEVVANDLLVACPALAQRGLGPSREALVEVDAIGLRDQLVGGVAHQGMGELEGVLVARIFVAWPSKCLSGLDSKTSP